MIFIVGLVFTVFVIGMVFVLALSRRWTMAEEREEKWLESPETHKMIYTVPDGIDPAAIVAALDHAGFTSVVEIKNGEEHVLVACEDEDHARVQEILDRVGAV